MIHVADLVKSYGDLHALTGISFDVPKGQVLGFLGPNGAGKSTTMKILTGYLPATSGTVEIDGLNAHTQPIEIKKQIGYLPESTPLYPDMNGREYLAYVASMRDIPGREQNQRIQKVADICGARSFMEQTIGTLSKGQRQRIGLAQALIHDPPILILDEPTSGLDPNQIQEIRSLIKELGKERTILLSTHNLAEVKLTCGRIIIIHRGAIVADGTPEKLETKEAANGEVFLEIGSGANTPEEDWDTVVTKVHGLDEVQEVTVVERGEERVTLRIVGQSSRDIRPVLHEWVKREGWILYELRRNTLDLEGFFQQLTGEA